MVIDLKSQFLCPFDISFSIIHFFTLFFIFLSGDCGIFVLKYVEFLMVGKPMSKVTPQRMSYFRKKMCLEPRNHTTLKAIANIRSDYDTT